MGSEIQGEPAEVVLVGIDEGMALGAQNIQTEEDRDAVLLKLRQLIEAHAATRVYGVFPTPIAAEFREDGKVACFAAWNVQRSAEGGKPTFCHKAWLRVGAL